MGKQGKIVRWDDARGFGFMRSADTPADARDWTGGARGVRADPRIAACINGNSLACAKDIASAE